MFPINRLFVLVGWRRVLPLLTAAVVALLTAILIGWGIEISKGDSIGIPELPEVGGTQLVMSRWSIGVLCRHKIDLYTFDLAGLHAFIDRTRANRGLIDRQFAGFGYAHGDYCYITGILPPNYHGRPGDGLEADHVTAAVIPFPLAILATAVLPAVRTFRWASTTLRRRRSVCINCGYDWRATPDRCPECGGDRAGVPASAGHGYSAVPCPAEAGTPGGAVKT